MSADQKPSVGGVAFATALLRKRCDCIKEFYDLACDCAECLALLFDQHTAELRAFKGDEELLDSYHAVTEDNARLRKALEEIRKDIQGRPGVWWMLVGRIDRIAREAFEGKGEGNG